MQFVSELFTDLQNTF